VNIGLLKCSAEFFEGELLEAENAKSPAAPRAATKGTADDTADKVLSRERLHQAALGFGVLCTASRLRL
jgi:hypothetical protein